MYNNFILPLVILTRFSSLCKGFQASFVRHDMSLSSCGINNWRGRIQYKVHRNGNSGELFALYHNSRRIANHTFAAIRKISIAGIFKFRDFAKRSYLKVSTTIEGMMQPDWIEIIGQLIGFFGFTLFNLLLLVFVTYVMLLYFLFL